MAIRWSWSSLLLVILLWRLVFFLFRLLVVLRCIVLVLIVHIIQLICQIIFFFVVTIALMEVFLTCQSYLQSNRYKP